ncbi:LytR C-terminal domain-containing protein [Streptomyces sp. NPDC002055]|uniref:LCP family protein n=1 Tax=Streptomyces sp. NPDC002055 TaxID=3154534 RepID=UPI003317A887
MNDAHSGRSHAEGGAEDGQDPYQQQYYDPYAQQAQQPYDPYAQQYYDPYGAQQPQQHQHQQPQYDEYGRPYYDPYAQAQAVQPPPQQTDGRQWIPQQQSYDGYAQTYAPAEPEAPRQEAAEPQAPPLQPVRSQPQVPRQPGPRDEAQYDEAQYDEGRRDVTRDGGRPGGEGPEYRTEQFSFIEEPDEESDDVIDWLKFAETRTERRDERKRKGRNRVVMLVVVLVLALVGGAGYLWFAGKVPGLSAPGGGAAAAGGGQKRDVIVVHLRDTKGGPGATALLVDNETTGKGTTVLLPNSLAVGTEDGGSTTLGKSVADEGTGPTRSALDTLLGARIQGSWRLDTPYLENLVESVGGITVDADATVPAPKRGDDPLVERGKARTLSGQAAVGYATHLAPGEPQTRQLRRFGQVMQAVLKKMSSDPDAATATVRSLAQIPDPSLTEGQLGASLAQLAEQAKNGAYRTALLPVRPDGTLSEQATDSVVKDVLGGTVKNTDPNDAPRISVRNATGDRKASSSAQVTLVNSGYTFVDGGAAGAAQTASRVTYADAAQAGKAKEVAKTLGLPAGAVAKGRGASNADITVVLGRDYRAG